MNKKIEELKISEEVLSKKINSLSRADIDKLIPLIKKDLPPNIKFPRRGCQAELQIIILYLFIGKLVHKTDMAKVGSLYLKKKQTDWQVRHLSSQKGFNILNEYEVIPNVNEDCPSGWHMLIDLNISPKYNAIKRDNLLSTDDFDEIKKMCGNKCVHCNSLEGDENFRDGKITKLQKGHMDSNKPLEIGNLIPLCGYCNRTYQDYFKFSPNGAIDKINIESKIIAKEILKKLKKKYGKDEILSWNIIKI